jgi:hypothetical protein
MSPAASPYRSSLMNARLRSATAGKQSASSERAWEQSHTVWVLRRTQRGTADDDTWTMTRGALTAGYEGHVTPSQRVVKTAC